MKAFQRSYKFLPETFHTPINRRFLSSTMDQLIVPTEPRQLNYYIGRRYSANAKVTDNYLAESNKYRNAYQVETGAAVLDPNENYSFGATFEDLINSLKYYGIDETTLQQVLADEFKPANFNIDLDKLINYGQYYWLANGPQAVTIDFSKENSLAIKLLKFILGCKTYYDNDYFYVINTNKNEHAADNFPDGGNPRELADIEVSFKIPLNPQILETQNQVNIPPGSMIGVAINGQPFYTYTMGSKEKLNDKIYTINTVHLENNAFTFTSTPVLTSDSFDRSEDLLHVSSTPFGGHLDINGIIHYHAYIGVDATLTGEDDLVLTTEDDEVLVLESVLADSALGHSRILGFAFDGFPIYGARGYANADGSGGVIRMTSSWRLKASDGDRIPDGRYVEDYEYVPGLGLLDANNGRFTVTPDYPNGTYAYFMTVDQNEVPVFPYIIGPQWNGNPFLQNGTVLPPTTATEFNGFELIDIEKDVIGKNRFKFNDITFLNGLKVKFNSAAFPAKYRNNEYYIEGVGRSIHLIPVLDLQPNILEKPETYFVDRDQYDIFAFDVNQFDGDTYETIDKHYLTVNRASGDGNAWSRSNRWFHRRVIEETAKYFQEPAITDDRLKAKRPIIEFEGGIALYNHARKNIATVDLYDTTQTRALLNVQGATGYYSDGVALSNGMNVVFVNDEDPEVRNKIYRVNVVGISKNTSSTYNVTLPSSSAPSLPGPYDWAPTLNNQFSIAGDFRSKRIQVKRDGQYLNPKRDYRSTVVYNPTGVKTIQLLSGGNGYTSAPNVTIQGAGSGAKAIAFVSGGEVINIVITNPGTGYNQSTTITIDPPTAGTAAVAEVSKVGLDQRLQIDLVQGSAASAVITVIAIDYDDKFDLEELATANDYDGIWVRSGVKYRGKNYYYLNKSWKSAQNKEKKTQAPLFDLFDENYVSVGDRSVYTGSTFQGNPLFSYKVGLGKLDKELGFPLSYRSTGLTGDIEYEWNHSKDSFVYTLNRETKRLDCESFYTYNLKNNVLESNVLTSAVLPSLPTMDLRYITVETNSIDLKTPVQESEIQETLFVELNDQPLFRGKDYDLVSRLSLEKSTTQGTYKDDTLNARLIFRDPLQPNDKLLITYWTEADISNTDLVFRPPLSLLVNPANDKIQDVTFSQMQSHLVSGAQLFRTLDGRAIGSNNLFSETSINPYCYKLGYHNGNLLMGMALLKNKSLAFLESLEYANNEYTKFKNYLIQNFDSTSFDDENQIPTMLDYLLSNFSLGKDSTFPFYDSDMVPNANNFIETAFTARYSQDKSYPISSVFVEQESNRRAVLIYHNGKILTRFRDYNFDTNRPSITIVPEYDIVKGDTILVREYDTTEGNWIPVTPSKIGLAPAYIPGIELIKIANNQQLIDVAVIRGHDGSQTPIFSDQAVYIQSGTLTDQRDSLILELENRIFNNIKKLDLNFSNEILLRFKPLAGYFRSTAADKANTLNSLDRFFGEWILRSRLNYSQNSGYKQDDPWTWNYRGQTDPYGKKIEVGYWQGLYQFYFDTTYPNLTPWEMLGFYTKPTWWEEEYGPAPYSKENLKLWQDLENGLVRQGPLAGVRSEYVRKGTRSLQEIIPIDIHGNLLSPAASVFVLVQDTKTLSADWSFGDGGPVEQAWRRSSEFYFAKQAYWALTNPRFYFGAAFDILDSKFEFDSNLLHRIYNTDITSVGAPVRSKDYESVLSKNQLSGYLVWIKARSKYLNSSTEEFDNFVKGVRPRLMYRMTGFTDKDKVQFYINSVAPGSKNALNLLPSDNFQLLLDRSSPIRKILYSGVMITRVPSGWKIEGYDTENTYFSILPSIFDNDGSPVKVGGTAAKFAVWSANQEYIKGQIVKYNQQYFKVTKDHSSGEVFQAGDLYFAINELPIVNAVTATLWKNYSSTPKKIYYGTVFRSVQEVFDFLISYGRHLESQGFIFDQFDSDLGEVKNWLLSAKEFLFWSTQNWSAGAVLTLSPSSELIQVYVPQGEVDSLYGPYSDPFSILNQNAKILRSSEIAVDRNFDLLTVRPYTSINSIYLFKGTVSEFDHLAIFDLKTEFNDIVLDPTTGTRQQRLQIKGSKSNSWNGKYFAPGFTIDQAQVRDWRSYEDYKVGNLVRYNNVVYAANINHVSEQLFNYNNWRIIDNQPEQELQFNLESLASRIEKFYNLDSEQISSDVSTYARHLIGYQQRDYLKDLLVDDETQYKFYQGMITQKGTEAAIYSLLRGANPGGIPEVDIKDDWALRVGEAGLADNIDQIEVQLDFNDLLFDTTMLDFTNSAQDQRDIIPVNSAKLLEKGNRTESNLFPTTSNNIFLQKYAGYARLDQVDATILSSDLLETVSSDIILSNGKIIWSAESSKETSQIFRTALTGPYKITVLPDNELSLNSPLELAEGEKIWIAEIFDGTITTNGALQTVSMVRSSTVFKIEAEGEFIVGDVIDAYIVKFVKAEHLDLVLTSKNTISKIYAEVPVKIELTQMHDFKGREKIFIDGVGATFAALNGNTYYVKVINNTTITLYEDRLLMEPVEVVGGSTGTATGTVYSDNLGASSVMYQTKNGQRLWIDNYTDSDAVEGWAVLKKQQSWNKQFPTTGVRPNRALLTNINSFGSTLHAWKYGSADWLVGTATINSPVESDTDQLVFVFERNNNDRNLRQVSIIRGETVGGLNAESDFGKTISHYDRDTLIIGAPNADRSGVNQGLVQLWKRDIVDGWVQLTASIGQPVGTDDAQFGKSLVRVDENLVLIGAPGTNAATADDAGAIYRLDRVGGKFTGYITGNILTVLSVVRGGVYIGAKITGYGVKEAIITEFITGIPISAGQYKINGDAQNVGSAQYPITIEAVGDTYKLYERNTIDPIEVRTKVATGGNGFAGTMVGVENIIAVSDPANNRIQLLGLTYVVSEALAFRSGKGYATGDTVTFTNGFSTPAILSLVVQNDIITRAVVINPGIRLKNPEPGVIYPDSTSGLGSGAGFVFYYEYGDIVSLITDTNQAAVLSGTTTVPVTADSPLAIYKRNNLLHVAYSSNDVAGGIVKIFEIDIEGISYTPKAGVKQVLTAPNYLIEEISDSTFGTSLMFTSQGKLLVGHPTSPQQIPTTFDLDTTFDEGITTFSDLMPRYGAIHCYGWYNNNSYVWEDSIVNPNPKSNDPSEEFEGGFGLAMTESNNILFASTVYGTVNTSNSGIAYEYRSAGDGWLIESKQKPLADVELIDRALTYDKEQDRVINFLDFWDPIKNVHDATAMSNLDYVSNVDPSVYQSDRPGNNYWGKEKVGTTWWDNSNSSWLWYEQEDLSYALKYWGELFPGAFVRVCEWVESSVVPSAYNINNQNVELGQPPLGASQPFNTITTFNISGEVVNKYYFWVTNKQTISNSSTKTLSASSIQALIVSGPSKWVAAAGPSALLTKNINQDLVEGAQILQVDVLRSPKVSPAHIEWQLVSEGSDEIIPNSLVDKMIDSLSGSDKLGNLVPDISLPAFRKLGTSIRPRQTMFKDRITAIQTSTEYINQQLAKIIVAEKSLGLMELVDPIPLQVITVEETFDDGFTVFDGNSLTFTSTTNNWNEQVDTYSDIIQEFLTAKPLGYKILVTNDENYNSVWTVYQWNLQELVLVNVQKFDTTKYWSRVDYYSDRFPKGSIPDIVVRTEQEFLDGDYADQVVKVLGPNYWRVLTKDEQNNTDILAMQNGTVRLDLTEEDFKRFINYDTSSFDADVFDPEPSIELRNILYALRDNVFTDEYRYIWNSWFFRMLRYALSEQKQLDWAFKSSFIRVKNKIANLETRPVYSLDVQDSLERYIKEIKPYHTKIREYISAYDGKDEFQNISTDFDCPPIVVGDSTVPADVQDSTQADFFRNTWPWRSYRDGRSYGVVAIVITDGGSGYVSQPTITFSGGTTVNDNVARPPKAKALIGISGQNFETLGDNNYFSFRKIWLDKQKEKDDSIDASDIQVQQYPNDSKNLVGGMLGTDVYPLKRIVVQDPGFGYLSPPTVTITGGGGSGAKAYAVLGDASARMLRTGIKFDRVKNRSDILYADVRDPSLDNPAFDEWHAGDRIAAYYNPTPGQTSLPQRITKTHTGDGQTTLFDLPQQFMYEELLHVSVNGELISPNNYVVYESERTIDFSIVPEEGAEIQLILNPPLVGLMSGADFEGTKIVGPKFAAGPGFDAQELGFDSIPFDTWDLDPYGNIVPFGGVDTYQESGRFVSAGGYDASQEIVSDGREFLSPSNIPSTEELLSGQVFDTLSFLVFTSPGENQTIELQNFVGTGSQTNFNLTPMPSSLDNITVFVNGYMKDPSDYTVNYQNSRIEFTVAPANKSIISVATTVDQGPSIEQIQTFVGTGSLDTFTIFEIGADDPLRDTVVTVNGIKQVKGVDYNVTWSSNNLIFVFTSDPPLNSLIRIVVYLKIDNTPVDLKNYTESFVQQITLDGSSSYTLDNPPGVPAPTSASTVVYVSDGNSSDSSVRVGQRLTPADTSYYIANGIQIDFTLPDCPGFNKSSLVISEIEVAINGEKQLSGFTLNVASDKITFAVAPAANSLITVTVLVSGDYYILNDDLYLTGSVVQSSSGTDTELTVYTYNDTVLTGMKTEVFTSGDAYSINYNGFGVYGFGVAPIDLTSISFFSAGQVALTDSISVINQANVFKNGRFLLPARDWFIEPGTNNIINIAGGLQPTDVVVVHYFRGSLVTYGTGFRLFKDMLGNMNYFRLSSATSTRLTSPVSATDNIIYIDDSSTMYLPSRNNNDPGVIMINKERIEYWTLGTTFISDLRRGTKGTAAASHAAGDWVLDQTNRNLLPKSDNLLTTKVIADGIQTTFDLPVLVPNDSTGINYVMVYVGGKRVTTGYSLNSGLSLTFNSAPKEGLQVLLVVKQSASWYDLSNPTASLNDSNTIWAEFIRAGLAPPLFSGPTAPPLTPSPIIPSGEGPQGPIGPQGPQGPTSGPGPQGPVS